MLKNLAVMLTGGGGSLGLATGKRLLAEGCKLFVFDLPGAKDGVEANLGKDVVFVGGDIRSEKDVEAAGQHLTNTFGRLDVLVNCAGIARARLVYNPKKETVAKLDEFMDVLAVNVGGTFNAVRVGAQLMAKNNPDADGLRGLVINTSGFYAFDGQIGQTTLAAAGGAVTSMTLPLCRDLAPVGIRVMTIAPGIMESNLTSFIPEKMQKTLGLFTPSPKRLGTADEYAKLVVSIIENKFLNGETIRLDGGLRVYLM